MKKILSMALALVMVLSMIPVMALVSSAEEEFESTKYGTGAETWRQSIKEGDQEIAYYMHTQFLLTVPKTTWEEISEKVGFTGTTYNKETQEWTIGGITSGKFVLSITDVEGVETDVVCPPTTFGNWGERNILRFETADYGTPSFQIQSGNTYNIQLKIFLDKDSDTPDYVGTPVDNVSWSSGVVKDGCDKMYSKNQVIDPLPKYTPKVDPYASPVEVDWEIFNGGFENHETWGRVMMIGMSNDVVPVGGNSGDNTIKTAAKIVIKWNDGTVKTIDSFASGNETFTTGGDVTYYRIPYDPFPAPGTYEDVTIEFVRKSDNKVMFTGTTTIDCQMTEDPETDTDTAIGVTLSSPANAGSEKPTKSDWEIFGDKPVLVVDMNGIVSEQDVHSNTVKWEVELDGKAVEVKNPLESVKDLGAGEDGKFGAQLRLDVGAPTEGEHKVKVKVSYNDQVLYESNEITVYYTEGTRGDLNGDGKVNASDRTYLARALANWDGYEVPDVSAGDLNGDGKVNAGDRTYLARALANWSGYSVE